MYEQRHAVRAAAFRHVGRRSVRTFGAAGGRRRERRPPTVAPNAQDRNAGGHGLGEWGYEMSHRRPDRHVTEDRRVDDDVPPRADGHVREDRRVDILSWSTSAGAWVGLFDSGRSERCWRRQVTTVAAATRIGSGRRSGDVDLRVSGGRCDVELPRVHDRSVAGSWPDLSSCRQVNRTSRRSTGGRSRGRRTPGGRGSAMMSHGSSRTALRVSGCGVPEVRCLGPLEVVTAGDALDGGPHEDGDVAVAAGGDSCSFSRVLPAS